jgi:hypothetical protein
MNLSQWKNCFVCEIEPDRKPNNPVYLAEENERRLPDRTIGVQGLSMQEKLHHGVADSELPATQNALFQRSAL